MAEDKKIAPDMGKSPVPNVGTDTSVKVDASRLAQANQVLMRNPQTNPIPNAEMIPANWELVQDADDETKITATNILTGRVFNGTRKEFSAVIRGK